MKLTPVFNKMLLTIFTLLLLHACDGKDICNQNAVLKEIDSFKLSQRVTKNLALDYEPYTGLIDQIKANKPDFETIMKQYTIPSTFDTEEPDKLIPFTNSVLNTDL